MLLYLAAHQKLRAERLRPQPVAHAAEGLHKALVEVNARNLALEVLAFGVESRYIYDQILVHNCVLY